MNTPLEFYKKLLAYDDELDLDKPSPLTHKGVIHLMTEYSNQLHKLSVSGSLPDAEIFLWLQKQKYQTEQGEQEYKMYFDVDMPKIIKAAIVHFSSGNDR